MSKIPNEKEQANLLESLAEKLKPYTEKAKAAINEHQPLGVSPKVGQAAHAIGATLALGVQQAVIARKSVTFFTKSIVKAYSDTRKGFTEAEKLYETMRNNIKKEVPPAPVTTTTEQEPS